MNKSAISFFLLALSNLAADISVYVHDRSGEPVEGFFLAVLKNPENTPIDPFALTDPSSQLAEGWTDSKGTITFEIEQSDDGLLFLKGRDDARWHLEQERISVTESNTIIELRRKYGFWDYSYALERNPPEEDIDAFVLNTLIGLSDPKSEVRYEKILSEAYKRLLKDETWHDEVERKLEFLGRRNSEGTSPFEFFHGSAKTVESEDLPELIKLAADAKEPGSGRMLVIRALWLSREMDSAFVSFSKVAGPLNATRYSMFTRKVDGVWQVIYCKVSGIS